MRASKLGWEERHMLHVQWLTGFLTSSVTAHYQQVWLMLSLSDVFAKGRGYLMVCMWQFAASSAHSQGRRESMCFIVWPAALYANWGSRSVRSLWYLLHWYHTGLPSLSHTRLLRDSFNQPACVCLAPFSLFSIQWSERCWWNIHLIMLFICFSWFLI